MARVRRAIGGLYALFRSQRVEQELDQELRAYLEASIEEKMRAGMGRDDAVRAARVELGSLEAVKDHTRDAGWETTLESFWRDVRYALRMLRRAPVFTTVAVLTLALGIGANVAVFTIVDGVLLRPLPFDEPERLVMLSESHVESGQHRVGVLPGSFMDWRERSRSFEAISLVWSGPALITNREEPVRVTGAWVSPNFFQLLGVDPLLGRTFPANEDDAAAHEREILISYGLWQRWFGSDPGVLGQTLELQGWVRVTIVGVMPPGFAFPGGAEIWNHERWERSSERGDRWRQVIGRLKPGIAVDAAASELQQIGVQLAREFPATNAGWTATVDPLADALLGAVRPPLRLLLAAVVIVFLIACVNVATLILQRGLARRRELATRAALGATVNRLARQTFIEYALLGGLGAVAGGALATFILEALVALAPPSIARLDTVTIDTRVLGYLVFVAIATMVVTGVVPALRTPRIDASAVLRGTAAGNGKSFGGRSLVIAEVALAVTLLTSAGLMVRTMVNLQRLDIGFGPSGVIASELRVPTGRMTPGPVRIGAHPAWDRLALFYADLVKQVEGLPNVQRAAVVSAPALVGREAVWFARTGIVAPRADGSPAWRPIQHRVVTPGYFDVLHLRLIRGRPFSDQDHALEFLRSGTGRRRGVAIVNRVAANQFWPGQDPLGQSLTIEGDSRVDGRIVVAIAGDARDLAPDMEPQATVYVPFAENPDFGATLLVRGAAGGLQPADIRARLRSTDSSLVIGEVRPLADSYASALAPRRFVTSVLIAFAATGLLVAGVGLYGLIAMSVAQRTREFGIRIALGATWRSIRTSVLGEAARVVGFGAVIGTVGAPAAAGLLRSQLFGVNPVDPFTWAATALVLLTCGFAAAWLPARRAASVEPAVTLRAE